MPSVRHILEPHIRRLGINETAKRVRERGVSLWPSTLSDWMHEKSAAGSAGPRRLNDQQIDALCHVLRLDLRVVRKARQ